MTVIEKIYFRENALFILTWPQYCQIIEIDRLVLAPYYQDKLMKQAEYLKDVDRERTQFNGQNRWEYENRINRNF